MILAALALIGAPLVQQGGSTPVDARTSTNPSVAESYFDGTGATIVVQAGATGLTLQSGPSTFASKPDGPDRYSMPERNLAITFAGDELTIFEGARVVAKAVRGAAPTPPPASQGAQLTRWLDAKMPSLLSRYHVPAAAIGYVDHGRVAWTRIYGASRRGVMTDAHPLFAVASHIPGCWPHLWRTSLCAQRCATSASVAIRPESGSPA